MINRFRIRTYIIYWCDRVLCISFFRLLSWFRCGIRSADDQYRWEADQASDLGHSARRALLTLILHFRRQSSRLLELSNFDSLLCAFPFDPFWLHLHLHLCAAFRPARSRSGRSRGATIAARPAPSSSTISPGAYPSFAHLPLAQSLSFRAVHN